MKTVSVGILGCGVISHRYIQDINRLYDKEIFLKAVADLDEVKAKAVAEQYAIPNAYSIEELLSDPSIELIVNLTPPKVHTQMNLEIVRHGKHLYCEKPFALNLDDAKSVLNEAKQIGVQVGSAPDSFMGSGIYSCRKYLKDGYIGKPLYVTVNMMTSGVESWHPEPEQYYKQGGGPIYDMGAYYFTCLVAMFGSVKSVYAVSETGFKKRTIYSHPHYLESMEVEVPTFYSAILTMESGVIVTLNFSFDIWKSSLPLFEVYGTEGTLMVPDPNMHGGIPKLFRKEQSLATSFLGEDTGHGKAFPMPELSQNVGEYVRGLGVAEMARAIREGRMCEANGYLALHVVDIMTSIIESAQKDRKLELSTQYSDLYRRDEL